MSDSNNVVSLTKALLAVSDFQRDEDNQYGFYHAVHAIPGEEIVTRKDLLALEEKGYIELTGTECKITPLGIHELAELSRVNISEDGLVEVINFPDTPGCNHLELLAASIIEKIDAVGDNHIAALVITHYPIDASNEDLGDSHSPYSIRMFSSCDAAIRFMPWDQNDCQNKLIALDTYREKIARNTQHGKENAKTDLANELSSIISSMNPRREIPMQA